MPAQAGVGESSSVGEHSYRQPAAGRLCRDADVSGGEAFSGLFQSYWFVQARKDANVIRWAKQFDIR